MASADNPVHPPAGAPSTAVQPADSGAPALGRPLAPPRTPPSPERLARRLRVLDGLLVAVVLAFAFLTALFPAHNSDFFLHAATGRLIAQGQYRIGVDPFSFATQGAYWVNPNWLYDLILSLVYTAGGDAVGGAILVVLKALMIAALAEVMLRAAREPGRSLWLPACCVCLAVLALSARVLLQPLCVSYLFLGVTCWLLRLPGQLRARAGEAHAPPPRRPFLAYWFIPPLCLLWVNLDGWFLLGPITVALFLVGESLQAWLSPAEEGRRDWTKARRAALGMTLLASVAACLVNPHHVWALLTPPAQLGLSPAAEALHADEQFVLLFMSPFEQTARGDWLYLQAYTGLNVAGMAFFPLVVLGAASFAAAQWVGRWRWGRALLWTAFLVLAVWRAAAIPFFAVVAGPITSLNFLDFAAKRWGAQPAVRGRAGAWALGGRALTLLAGVLLLVASWPGWLQSAPQEWRRAGWGVAPDPGLKRLAEQIAAWRKDGLIPDDARWFNTNPAVLPYLAWYCPGQRGFLDNQRPALYDAGAAAEYRAVRRSLAREGGDAGKGEPGWRPRLRGRDVHFLIWYDLNPVPMRASSPLPTLFGAPDEWPLLYLDGPGGVFGWRDPDAAKGAGSAPDPFARLEVRDDREAFGAGAAPVAAGPAPDPQPHEWWTALWAPEKPRPPDSDEAAVRWVRFSLLQPLWRKNNETKWNALWADNRRNLHVEGAAACLGAGATWAGPCQTVLVRQILATVPEQTPLPTVPQQGQELEFTLARQLLDFGPPAELYLGIRAARRAVAQKPDDALAYEYLAQTYFALVQQTREGHRAAVIAYPPGGTSFPEVLRRVQIATALHRALMIDPDNQVTEGLSAELYFESNYIDLGASHNRERLRILRETGGASAAELKRLEDEVKRAEDEVKRRQDAYELQAVSKPPVQKSEMALGMGLAQTALDELTRVDWNALKDDDPSKVIGVQRELSLLVQTGHADDVGRTLAEQEQNLKDGLGVDPYVSLPAYEWLRLQVAAARGDYADADHWLEELAKELHQAETRPGLPLQTLLGQLAVFGPGAEGPREADTRSLAALLAGHIILRSAPAAAGAAWLPVPPSDARLIFLAAGDLVAEPLGRQADLKAVRGWLALEAGETAAARAHFEAALRLAPQGEIRFRGRPLTELGIELLDSAK